MYVALQLTGSFARKGRVNCYARTAAGNAIKFARRQKHVRYWSIGSPRRDL